MNDFYSAYHPVVGFLHFTAVMTFTMIFTHPACLVISLVCAAIYALPAQSRKGGAMILAGAAIAFIINPLFNHEGATIFCYFPNGNPLTLESIIYGAAAAGMFAAALLWFYCYGHVLTSDKTACVLGGAFPSAALIMSITMRLVPKIKTRLGEIASAQGAFRDDTKSFRERVLSGIGILSIMLSWMLEDSVETADSMKSRGYGLPGRTYYSVYVFRGRDRAAVVFILASAAYVVAGIKALRFSYFPVLRGEGFGLYFASLFAVYASLCAAPLVINILEGIKWRVRKSKV